MKSMYYKKNSFLLSNLLPSFLTSFNKLIAEFGNDDVFKLKLDLKMARENLNSLRKINVDKITDEKIVLEILELRPVDWHLRDLKRL